MRRSIFAVAIGLAVLVGCSSAEEPPESTSTSTAAPAIEQEPLAITGTVTTRRSGDYYHIRTGDMPQIAHNGDSCGFGDLGTQTQMIVESSTGEIIGVGTIGEGDLIGLGPEGIELTIFNSNRNSTKAAADCVLPFAVDLSSESPFYTIAIDGVDGLTFTHDELESTGWIVNLTVG